MARDRIAWMASNTGEYTVKTGYQFWSAQFPGNADSNSSTGWNKLWKLRVPHKIRTFYGDFATTLFLFASECWRKAGTVYDMQRVEKAPPWLLDRITNEKAEASELIAKGKNMRFPGMVTILEAEAKGVQEAIKWLEFLNSSNVTVECDSEVVVKAINTIWKLVMFFRGVEQDSVIEQLSLCHVKRQQNQAAHLLARVACLVNCYNIFLSHPDLLLKILSSDYSA
ncbi:hypothetical protein AgCh_013043 [Apium graveolens]